jgi:hypothetical protein
MTMTTSKPEQPESCNVLKKLERPEIWNNRNDLNVRRTNILVKYCQLYQ